MSTSGAHKNIKLIHVNDNKKKIKLWDNLFFRKSIKTTFKQIGGRSPSVIGPPPRMPGPPLRRPFNGVKRFEFFFFSIERLPRIRFPVKPKGLEKILIYFFFFL